MAEEELDELPPVANARGNVGQRDVSSAARTEERVKQNESVPVEWTWIFFQLATRQAHCTQLVIYLVFALFSTVIFQMVSTSASFFAVQDSILKHTARASISSVPWERTFYDLSSDAQWWDWVQQALLPTILKEDYFNGDLRANASNANGRFTNTVAMYNKQTATIRFRQARVSNNSCSQRALARSSSLGYSCWGPFTQDAQFTSQFGTNYGNQFLRDMNEIQSAGNFGLGYGTSGHVVDIPLNKDVALNTTSVMKNGSWINEQTRMISVETSWYNANDDVGTYCRFQVDISPSGFFRPSVVIQSCRLGPYKKAVDKLRALIEILFVFMLIYYIGEAGCTIRVLRTGYFKAVWNWLEMLVLVLYMFIVAWWIAFLLFDKGPFEVVSSGQYANRPDLSKIAGHYTIMAKVMSFTVVFAYVKLFKYLQAAPSIAQLWCTLQQSLLDMFPFLIVFLLFTSGFSFAGHWIFGVSLKEFSSWTQSFATLLLTMVGGFPYAAMARVAPFSAAVFTTFWVLLMVMILANMFIAILTESYRIVQEDSCEEDAKLRCKVGNATDVSLLQLFKHRIRLGKSGHAPLKAANVDIFRMLRKANLVNTEHLRTAVLQGKTLVPEDLAQHFGGNLHATKEFVHRVQEAAHGEHDVITCMNDVPMTGLQADVVAHQQLGDLQKTVARLEDHLMQLRGALSFSGVTSMQEGAAAVGDEVETVSSGETESHADTIPGADTEN